MSPIVERVEGAKTSTGPSPSELVQFAYFEIARLTGLRDEAVRKKSQAEIKMYTRTLEEARKRIELLTPEVMAANGNFELLQKNVTEVAKEANDAVGTTEDYDTAEADREAYDGLVTFLNQNREGNFKNRVDFKKWQQEQLAKQMADQEAEAEQRAATRQKAEVVNKEKSAAALADIRKREGFPPPPEVLEREREKYIQEVLEQGGFKIHTCLHKDDLPQQRDRSNNNGFQTVVGDSVASKEVFNDTSNEIWGSFYEQTPSTVIDSNDTLKKHKRNEVVAFQRATKPVYETVPAKKGFFGVGAKPEGRREAGREPRLHSELVKNGKAEQAVSLVYKAEVADDSDSSTKWTEYDGRPGQTLSLEILLPESTAKALSERLAVDPALIRHIAEQVFKKKLLANQPDRWEKPSTSKKGDSLAPPYDKWDRAQGGGKIYVRPLDAPPGWQNENDRPIRAK